MYTEPGAFTAGPKQPRNEISRQVGRRDRPCGSGMDYNAATPMTEPMTSTFDGRVAPGVRDIDALGRRAIAVGADVSCEPDVDRLFADIAAALGPIDVLVSNAAIVKPATIDTLDRVLPSIEI